MSWLLAVAVKNALLALPLAALALLVGRWLRRPALAHVLWAVVLLKLLTPPLVDVPVGWRLDVEGWLAGDAEETVANASRPDEQGPAKRSPTTSSSSPIVVVSSSPYAAPAASAGGPASASPSPSASHPRVRRAVPPPLPPGEPGWNVPWRQWAGAIWLTGSLVMLTVLARRAWRFRRFIRLAVQRDEYLPARVAELAHAAGVGVSPRVIVVEGIVSPMLWGLGENARLVFPAQLVKRLSPAKLDTLLLHELAHFARKDHWLRALELAACIVYWWNPLVWWARREIERAEEECCDAWVIERQNGVRHSYAEALLTTVDFLCERRAALPPAACGIGEAAVLRARLTQIMQGEAAARLSRWGQVLVLTTGLLLSLLQPALWATSSATATAPPPAAKLVSAASPDAAVDRTASQDREATVIPQRPPAPAASGESSASLSDLDFSPPRPAPIRWATAVSPNGKFRVEAHIGWRATLIHADSGWRLGLNTYQIKCLSFAPDSRTFATGHDNAVVRLWDNAGRDMGSFKGSDAITSVHIAPDGRRLAAGSRDGSVVVWDLTTGDELARLPRQGAEVSCVRWSKRGDRLAIAMGAWNQPDEAALCVWSPDNDLTRLTLKASVSAVDWLGDDRSLLIADWEGQCQIRSIEDASDGRAGRVSREPTGHLMVDKDHVSTCNWSPDCPLVSKWLADQLVSKAH